MTDQSNVIEFPQPEVATEAETFAPVLYKFTNQSEENSRPLNDILAMFYIGVGGNTIGIMQAFNLTTEQEELILVGVQIDEDGKADCYPLASILNAEQARQYLAPNGQGGYYDPMDVVETAAAKENMKSYDEAIVQDPVIQN